MIKSITLKMQKVIVKFQNGEEKSGEIMLFNLNQQVLQFYAYKNGGEKELQVVRMDTVKAILFLKKEETYGSHFRTETIENSIYAGTLAFRIVVEFKDGEIMSGSTLKYNPNDKGFFLVPLNPADRSERIYINAQAVKNVDCKRLLGKILVDQKKITQEQLVNSLKYQFEKREKKIGTILRENSIITQSQLEESLKKQKEKNKMLGEILLEAGYITQEQLENALKIQKENKKKKLGQVLVELKYITPNDICIALATQFHKPWMDMSDFVIPENIVKSIPVELITKYEIIPVDKKPDGTIIIASSNPDDAEIKSELSKLANIKTELVFAYEGYIESAIKKYFPQHT
jgi:hypothetical protein